MKETGCGKLCFDSEKSARKFAKRFPGRGDAARAYFCKICRAWHLTTQQERDELRPVRKPYDRNKFKRARPDRWRGP